MNDAQPIPATDLLDQPSGRAVIDLPPRLRAQLDTTGLTANAVAEQLGIRRHQAIALLRTASAVNTSGVWRIPNLERNQRGWRLLSRPACSTGRAGT